MKKILYIPMMLLALGMLILSPEGSAQAAVKQVSMKLGTTTVDVTDKNTEYTFTPDASYYYQFKGVSDLDTEIIIRDDRDACVDWSSDSYKADGTYRNNDFDTVVWLEKDKVYTIEFGMEPTKKDPVPTLAVTLSKAKVTLKSAEAKSADGITIEWEALNTTSEPCYAVYRKKGTGSWVTIGRTYDTVYVDTTPKGGSSYTYTVRACMYTDPEDVHGSSYNSTGLKVFCLASMPGKNLGLSNTTKGVKVTWKTVTGAEGYRIYRKTSSGSYKKIGSVSGGSKDTYTDTTPASGTTYTYSVRAYKGDSLGYGTGKSIRYLAPILKDDITLNNVLGGVRVTWKKVTGAKGYYVYRRTTSGKYEKIGSVSGATTVTYDDTKAVNGTTYLYSVRAYNGDTLGSYAGRTTVRLSSSSISSLTNAATLKMTVKWTQNSKASGYQIQYSTDSGFPSASVKSTTVTGYQTVSKSITGLTKGKTYYVRVRSYKTVDGVKFYSGWCTKKSVKIEK